MAAEVARRLGVPLQLVPFPSPGLLADSVDDDVWDIGNIGAEPQRAEKIAFTAAYCEIEATYLVPAGSGRPVPGLGAEEIGPDADDPVLTLDLWRDRIRRHPGELKNLLRNQAFVAGIGNAYSDEILHAAGLHPFRRRSSLATEEVDGLYAAMRTTLAEAIEVLRRRVPPTFETQVRDFLAVHLKGGRPCPRCGARISEVKAGGHVTSYCRSCQH